MSNKDLFYLNDDVITHILSFCSKEDMFVLRHSNKYFNNRIKKIKIPFHHIFSSINLLEFYLKHSFIQKEKKNWYKFALSESNVDVFNFLYNYIGKEHLNKRFFTKAIEKGNLNILKWLIEKKVSYPFIYTLFLFEEDKHIFKYLSNNLIYTDSQLYTFLKEKNNRTKENLKWIFNSSPLLKNDACEIAIQLNDLNLLKCCVSLKCDISSHSYIYAFQHRNYELLNYMSDVCSLKLYKSIIVEIKYINDKKLYKWIEEHC